MFNIDIQSSVRYNTYTHACTVDHMDEGDDIFTSLTLHTLDTKTQQTYLRKIASPSLPVAISFLVAYSVASCFLLVPNMNKVFFPVQHQHIRLFSG